MANTFREVYKKTGDSSYQLVGNVGVGGIKLDIMKGASSESAGEIGLVPKPPKLTDENEKTDAWNTKFLASTGEWVTPFAIGEIWKAFYVNNANVVSSLDNVQDNRIISHCTYKNNGSYDSFVINLSSIGDDGWRQVLQFHFWLTGSNTLQLKVRARIWGTWTNWLQL